MLDWLHGGAAPLFTGSGCIGVKVVFHASNKSGGPQRSWVSN